MSDSERVRRRRSMGDVMDEETWYMVASKRIVTRKVRGLLARVLAGACSLGDAVLVAA